MAKISNAILGEGGAMVGYKAKCRIADSFALVTTGYELSITVAEFTATIRRTPSGRLLVRHNFDGSRGKTWNYFNGSEKNVIARNYSYLTGLPPDAVLTFTFYREGEANDNAEKI